MQVPPTGIPKTGKKATAKKTRVKMRDLLPRKNARGGSEITHNDPPLPIPPPGFIVAPADGKTDEKK